MDLDYFDRQDLGKLRRRLRKGIETFKRERELYLELVQSYLEVRPHLKRHARSLQST